jgi:hypothetical protein
LFANWGDIDSSKEAGHLMISMISGAIILILFIALLFSVPNIVDAIFNPEYWALNKILSVVK